MKINSFDIVVASVNRQMDKDIVGNSTRKNNIPSGFTSTMGLVFFLSLLSSFLDNFARGSGNLEECERDESKTLYSKLDFLAEPQNKVLLLLKPRHSTSHKLLQPKQPRINVQSLRSELKFVRLCVNR